jgi:hypothetical protein
MKVEVSVGEAIDKLSILELKLKKITNENKQIEIQKEINALAECIQYKNYYLYYNLLMYVNEKIWDMTDLIKSSTVEDPKFAYLSNQIFEFNQKRFRIKNWYNLIASSDIKEQKSYSLSQCKIIINDSNTFYNKISEIIYLALEYDVVTIVSNFNDKVKTICKIPTILYSEYGNGASPSVGEGEQLESVTLVKDSDNINNNTIYLENFEIPYKDIIPICEFKPLIYISGGLLGDFVHQLSIINEQFLNTGRKGVLYIANDIGGENFKYGLTKTHEDTYKLVVKQNYIKMYKIFNNEPYDINLSIWRNGNISTTWDKIFLNTYNIPWGINKWINVPHDDIWKDTILINTTSYRPAYNINFLQICKIYGKSVKFINLNNVETELFKSMVGADNANFYSPTDLYELCIAINSCKLFIGNLSSPLAFAYAMHKKSVVGLCSGDQIRHLGLEQTMPNLIINSNINVVMGTIKQLCD